MRIAEGIMIHYVQFGDQSMYSLDLHGSG